MTNLGQAQIQVECINTLLSDDDGQLITIFDHDSLSQI